MNAPAAVNWLRVTSRSNPRVKRIAALRERRGRAQEGLCWLETRPCVYAALAAGVEIDELALAEDAQRGARELARTAAARGIRVIEYTRECFTKISVLRSPDGIGAVIAAPRATAVDALELPAVVAWSLQDPGNLGSIVRSTAALGGRSVLNVTPAVDLLHPLCLRATAGAIFAISHAQADRHQAQRWLDVRAGQVAVLSADGQTRLADCRGEGIHVLVIGSEAHGVPQELRVRYRCVAIPMHGGVESMNVNAAAAVALYAFWGRRIEHGEHHGDLTLPRPHA